MMWRPKGWVNPYPEERHTYSSYTGYSYRQSRPEHQAFEEGANKILEILEDHNEYLNWLQYLRDKEARCKALELAQEVCIDIRPLTTTAIIREIREEIRKQFSSGRTLCYSDIAEELELDLEVVVSICDELQESGELRIDESGLWALKGGQDDSNMSSL